MGVCVQRLNVEGCTRVTSAGVGALLHTNHALQALELHGPSLAEHSSLLHEFPASHAALTTLAVRRGSALTSAALTGNAPVDNASGRSFYLLIFILFFYFILFILFILFFVLFVCLFVFFLISFICLFILFFIRVPDLGARGVEYCAGAAACFRRFASELVRKGHTLLRKYRVRRIFVPNRMDRIRACSCHRPPILPPPT